MAEPGVVHAKDPKQYRMAAGCGIVRCSTCHNVLQMPTLKPGQVAACPRCCSQLHFRYPRSLSRTWAWLLTAFVLFFPANLLPVMTVMYFGDGQPDTIMSGVLHLLEEGQYPVGILVFIASIFVPLLKMVGIAFLLIIVQLHVPLSRRQCTFLYRFIELIGRWSMLDLFMISILVTLVDMGSLASVTAGAGATAFATVVVVTMFAAHTFDPRLIWDLRSDKHDR